MDPRDEKLDEMERMVASYQEKLDNVTSSYQEKVNILENRLVDKELDKSASAHNLAHHANGVDSVQGSPIKRLGPPGGKLQF